MDQSTDQSTDQSIARAARAAYFYLLALTGHEVGDFGVQTDSWANAKGAPGHNPARYAHVGNADTWKANQKHVATYHLSLVGTFAAGCLALGLRVSPRRAALAFAVSYGTHTLLDRRWPIRMLMDAKGAPKDAELLRMMLDQMGHKAVLAALATYLA